MTVFVGWVFFFFTELRYNCFLFSLQRFSFVTDKTLSPPSLMSNSQRTKPMPKKAKNKSKAKANSTVSDINKARRWIYTAKESTGYQLSATADPESNYHCKLCQKYGKADVNLALVKHVGSKKHKKLKKEFGEHNSNDPQHKPNQNNYT